MVSWRIAATLTSGLIFGPSWIFFPTFMFACFFFFTIFIKEKMTRLMKKFVTYPPILSPWTFVYRVFFSTSEARLSSLTFGAHGHRHGYENIDGFSVGCLLFVLIIFFSALVGAEKEKNSTVVKFPRSFVIFSPPFPPFCDLLLFFPLLCLISCTFLDENPNCIG